MWQKKFFLFLLSIAPFYVLKNYLVITFFIFMHAHRHRIRNETDVDMKKLQYILNMTCNRNTILFPYTTLDWIWTDNLLDGKIEKIDGQYCSIRCMLKNREEINDNLSRIVDYFMKNIPKPFYRKIVSLGRAKDAVDIRYTFGKTILAHG